MDRVVLILKVGDCETAPGKEWLGIKHLDPVCIVDEAQWNADLKKAWDKLHPQPVLIPPSEIGEVPVVPEVFVPLTLEEIISPETHKIFAVVEIDRKILPTALEAITPTIELDPTKEITKEIKEKYRARKYRIDIEALKTVSSDPMIESKLLDKNTVVETIDGKALTETAFLDTTKIIAEPIKDINAITSGSATVGAGKTYTTWALAWADVGNLTGNLNLQQETAITETAGAVSTVSLNGYTWVNNALPANYGDATYTGLLLTLNHTAHGFSLGMEGPGTLKIHDMDGTRAQADTNKGFISTETIDAAFTAYIYRNIYDGQTTNATNGIRWEDSTPILYFYSNIFFSINNAIFYCGAGGLNSASIIENNTCHTVTGTFSVFNVNNNGGTFRNNFGYGAGSDGVFYQIGSATGYNNAADDTSCADGNWATGSGNKVSLTEANEVESTDYQDGDAFDRPVLNGNLYRTGASPGVADVAINNFTMVPGKIDIGAKFAYGIIYKGQSNGSATATNTITLSHTIANGNKRTLLVSLAWEGNPIPTVSSIQYNNTNMTLVGNVTVGTVTKNTIALYYLLEASLPAAGAYNIVVNFSGNFTGCLITALEFINVSALDTYATNTATSTTDISTYITPAEANELLIDGVVSGGENTFLSYAWQFDRYDHNIPAEPGVSHGGSTAIRALALIAQVGETASSSQARLAQIVAAFKLGAEASTVDPDHNFGRSFDTCFEPCME